LWPIKPAESETFRMGGLVEEGSLVRGSGETDHLSSVTDGAASVPVSFTGVLPDLFGEGQGMIGTGRMQGETFVATEILAKHDENYMPKEVIDALKEQGTYVDPKEATALQQRINHFGPSLIPRQSGGRP
jgi:cytochrome c-type biogenesis protein CcmE